jgi:primosomal replication protein N
VENGQPREVRARIAIVLVGGNASLIQGQGLREGQSVTVTGFLCQAGYKGEARDRLQLIAETLEPH